MSINVKFAINGVIQAAILPDATPFNDGMMTPTQLRQLEVLFASLASPPVIVPAAPYFVSFMSSVALPQEINIPNASAQRAGVMTKEQAAALQAAWVASGKTLPAAPKGLPLSLRFDVNLSVPQSVQLPPAAFGGARGGGAGGQSGALTGEGVQMLGAVVSAPPASGWTQNLIAANAGVQEVWGISKNEIYASDRNNVYKWDGAAWALSGLSGVNQINALWGTVGSIWAMGGIHLRKSVDNGANWVDQPAPIAGWSNGQAMWGMPDNSIIYISGSYPGHGAAVLQSVDGGANWTLAFDQPDGDVPKGIFGYAANDVYFVGFNDGVYHWNGAALTQIQAPTGNESSFACWGPASGQIYWCTDVPTLPVKQVMHAVGAAVFAETGPWITNGGGAPDDEVWGISGFDANHIYAAGFNNNGAKAYKISVPNNAGPGTWVLDALPSGADTDPGAQALQVWVDPATGFVMMVGSRSNGDGVSWSK